MSRYLDSSQLSQLSKLISAKMGLHFPEARWHDLERGLASAAAALGFPDLRAYSQSLLSGPLPRNQIEELSTHLTIGETYFFREKPTFSALREQIFPELIRSRRGSTKQLRVWSAGCCTGEEAYSCAILLNQLIPDLSEWMLTILATDINPRFLHKAVAGIYGEWSFRDIPPNIKDRYFTQTATGRFELLPSIKQQVHFSLLNLAEESYWSPFNNTNAMDLILCRNVLMYFSPEQAKKVVRNLYHSLAEGGWLVASLGEASHVLFSDFKMVQFPNAILYQKTGDSQTFEVRFGKQLEEHPREKATLYAIPEMPQHGRARDSDFAPPAQPLRQSRLHPSHIGAAPAVEPLPSPQQTSNQQASQSQAFYDQGRYAEAEVQVRVELLEKPEDAAALVLLARICANQRRLDEALEWCKRSIAADRLNLRGYYLYATIQEERGEIEDAIKSLNRALYLHPEFVLAHFALGYLARRQGKKREADKHFANMRGLLKTYRQDEVLPESDGWTAGRLSEMVSSTSLSEKLQ